MLAGGCCRLWGKKKKPWGLGRGAAERLHRVLPSPLSVPTVPTGLPRAPGLCAPARAARGFLQAQGRVLPTPAGSCGGAWPQQPVLPHGQLRRGAGCAQARPGQLIPSLAAFPGASAAAALPPVAPCLTCLSFPPQHSSVALQGWGSLVRACRAGREALPRHAGEQQKL